MCDDINDLSIEKILSYKDIFNLMFNEVEEYLFILDENGNIIKVNNAVLNKLQYNFQEEYPPFSH